MPSYTGNCGGYTIILNVIETDGSANVGSNTSKVSWSLQFRSGASYCQWNPGPGDFSVTINGSAVWSAQNPSLWFTAMNQTITLASGTTGAITHNSDGKKTVSCKATYTQNSTASYLPSSGSCSGNLTLTTIPRASSFSSISGNTIGGSQTININRKSSSFTHSLWYKVGSGSWISIGTGIATSKTWTLPTSLNNQIPSATSLTLTYLLRTYNGSTQIGGDVTYNFNVNYSGEKPTAGTATITYSNLFNNKFIANYSSATISYSGYAGIYGSTIKSAQVIFNGSWKGTTSYNTGLLTAGTHTFQGVATDTRNNSSYTTQQSFTCYQINNPTISINAYRSDAEGNADPSGTYITIIPTYSAHDPVGGNSIESSSFTCTSLMTTAIEIASGDKKIISGAAKDGQYTISGTVTDKLGRTSATSAQINTAFTILDVRSDQTGVAFGKYSTGANKFEVAWSAYFDKEVNVDSNIKSKGNNVLTTSDGVIKDNAVTKDSEVIAHMTAKSSILGFDQATGDYLRAPKNGFLPNVSGGSGYVGTNGWPFIYGYFQNLFTKNIYSNYNNILGIQFKSGTADGDGIIIGAGGTTVIGAGESGGTTASQLTNYSDEVLYLTSDGGINVITNLQYGWSSRHTSVFNANGSLTSFYFVSGDTGHRCTSGNGITHFRYASNSNGKYIEITAGGNGAYGIYMWSSDRKLKEHIKNTEIRYALDKISQLQHVEFDWKDGSGKNVLGYIADDVEKVLSCLVFDVEQEDGSTIKHIDTRTMIPLITMGIQELIEEKDLLWEFDNEVADCIISLKEENDKLKEQVNTMASTIEELKAEIESIKQSISKGA